jgi:exopolyphosphatase / guanosine-5'-triphosphate,3'-diphosphate pyrophosphatase
VSPSPERLAAIDVGSNTVLLTVADYDGAKLTTVEEGEDQPRLGAGLGTSGRLSEAAMGRAVESLARMRDRCRSLGVQRVEAVATAAVREAANAAEFLDRVRALDVPLRLISPETEAALSYRSAAYRFPTAGRMLVADIGGGSLELVGAAIGSVTLTVSLPLGAVRLTELQLSPGELGRHIERILAAPLSGRRWRRARIVGSGGTFATLASMVLAGRKSGSPVHGTIVSDAEVRELLMSLAGKSHEERRHTPGLPPKRADIIVAGVAVVAELLRLVEAAEVTVSGFGLRDGLLLEMVELLHPPS